jgi:outer membrane receptor for ferric coprogen and ferric-rhodotorulic acid
MLHPPLAVAQTTPSATADAETHDFAIPAQPLAQAVLVLSEQAGTQLIARSEITAGVSSKAVIGRLSIPVALDRLLDGTGLRWRYVGSRIVTIERGDLITSKPFSSPPAVAPRVFAPLRIEGDRDTRPVPVYGSTDATATEGGDSLAATESRVGSKVPQPMFDTPRSISILTAARLDQQGLNNTGETLREMPGVTARMVDGITGYSFLSRGFKVTTFAFDGGGPTFYQTTMDADVRGALDAPELAAFDHVELLRGPSGPFGGIADPGGVVNFQRKRPLDHGQFVIDFQAGSWNNRRIEVDATTPVAFDGRLRARVVAVAQDRDFYYNITHESRAFIFGTIEADIGESTVIRLGGSYRDLLRSGFNASGLPRYMDGGDLRLPRSTCLCISSNRYGGQQGEQFATVERRIGDHWQITVNATRRTQKVDFSAATQMTMARGVGDYVIFPFISAFGAHLEQTTADVAATGDITLGRTRLTIATGMDFATDRSRTFGKASIYSAVLGSSPFEMLADLARPDRLGDPLLQQSLIGGQRAHASQFGPYLSLSAKLMERITLQIGARKPFYQFHVSKGTALRFTGVVNFPGLDAKVAGPITPNLSLSYEPASRTRLYASYGRIFRVTPIQSEQSASFASVTGNAFEVGAKWQGTTEGPFVSASAYFQTMSGLAIGYPLPGTASCCSFRFFDVDSYGVDLEINGMIRPRWQVQVAYNWNRNLHRADGTLRPWEPQQPKHQLNLWSSYRVPARLGDWAIAAGLRLQSTVYSHGEACEDAPNPATFCVPFNTRPFLYPIRFVQPLYAVGTLRLARRFTNGIEVALNINNVTNTRYYATTAGPAFGNYYGEPRSFLLSLKAVID